MRLTGAEDHNRLERIEACGSKCSQGLICSMKSHFLFPLPCKSPPEEFHTPAVFQNLSLSTVLRCDERDKCSMYLRIQTRLQLSDSIKGVSICTSSPGLFPNCRIISFSRDSRKRLSSSQVDIENDCTKLSVEQEVHVTLETFPSYCGANWTQAYTAPGCTKKDLRRHVPDCITGKLLYKLNAEEKSLTVNVTEMREDHTYNLRLCHDKGYVCMSAGPLTVIKKEDPIKSATLSYAKVVPCLCIEGWSNVLDAHRVRVCPFRQHVEELWTGITFDPTEVSLSWHPQCPLTARVTLCQKQEQNDCIDIPHTSHNVSKQKVKFVGVESHPQLCLKFSVEAEDWIRCPFDNRIFTVWEVSRNDKGDVVLFSPAPGIFSVDLCDLESVLPSQTCLSTQGFTVEVEKMASVEVPLPTEILPQTFCLQVRRKDLRYSTTHVHCFDQNSKTSFPTWIIASAGVLLALVILTMLVLHIWLTVHQKMMVKSKDSPCLYEAHKDVPPVCVVSAPEPDSATNNNNEKVNLLSD
uniref:Interleukin-17 receptor C/E N-terminal domain-containing protein n=1 Tax=Knipowitschia caucasica TaxID=637954 RepID=A0AAV2ITV8_KNICA